MRAATLAVRTLVALACVGAAMTALAQAQASDRAKAGIVVNLARFVRWPAAALRDPGDALHLCVVQRSRSIAAAFSAHAGERIGSRVLHVNLDPAPGATGCHLLFIHESAGPAAPAAIAAAAGSQALIIGDFDGTLARGGMVELVHVDDALRFDVDLRALRGASIELSSEVLRLARQARP